MGRKKHGLQLWRAVSAAFCGGIGQKSDNPHVCHDPWNMQRLEDRVLLSGNPYIAGANQVYSEQTYTLDLVPGSSTESWRVYWGDGATATFNSTSTTATHTFTALGNYDITANAYPESDCEGTPVACTLGMDPNEPTSGGNGIVTTDLGTASVQAVNADGTSGNVLVLTNNTLMEYNTAGAVVTSFGGSGHGTVSLSSLGTATLVGVAGSSSTGDIAVGAYTSTDYYIDVFNPGGELLDAITRPTSGNTSLYDVEFSGSEVALAGQDEVDGSFENSLCLYTVGNGSASLFDGEDGQIDTSLYATAFAPDGSIWAVGTGASGSFIEHYSSSGAIIELTGGADYALTSSADANDFLITVRPSGDPLVGEPVAGGEVLSQFTTGGSLDTRFNGDGTVTLGVSNVAGQVAAFGGGNLLDWSWANDVNSVSDYDGAGELVGTFGNDGVLPTSTSPYGDDYALEIGGMTQLSNDDYELAAWDGTNLNIDFVEPVNYVMVQPPMPASDPALQSGMIPFTWPLAGNMVTDPSLDIAASDLSASASGSIVFTGSFASGDYFQEYGNQDTDSAAFSPTLTTSDGATVTLDSSPSMYLFSATNLSSEVGDMVAVNQTDATWMGAEDVTFNPDITSPEEVADWDGQTVSVYGRNLSNLASTPQSWVYLQPDSGSGVWATVTSVNNYQVQFTIPSDLTSGEYEVWINNGLGGEYGWSMAPGYLTVTPQPTWPDEYEFNVTDPSSWPDGYADYGGTSQGADGTTTNDDLAITNALDAIAAVHASGEDSMATLYFPALSGGASYNIGISSGISAYGINLSSNTRLLGDGDSGESVSSLVFADDMTVGVETATPLGDSDVEIDDVEMSFADATSSSNVFLVAEPEGSNFTLSNDYLNPGAHVAVDWDASTFLRLENSTIIGGQPGGDDILLINHQPHDSATIIDPNNITISNTTFEAGYDVQMPIFIDPAYDISITGCTVEEMDASDTTDTTNGWGQGDFIDDAVSGGDTYNEYIGGNQAMTMGTPVSQSNQGNLVLADAPDYGYYGTLSAAPTLSSTVTIPGDSGSSDALGGYALFIAGGTGVGQMLPVTSSSSSDDITTLSLGGSWSVMPDSSSVVLVETALYNSVFYDNSVTYVTGENVQYAWNLTASCEIQLSTGYGLVIDGNTSGTSDLSGSGGNGGIMLSSTGFDNDVPSPLDGLSPLMDFAQVMNNKIYGTWEYGISTWQQAPTDFTEQNFIGTIISNNTISDVDTGSPSHLGDPGDGFDADAPAQGISLAARGFSQ
jgi:hypothetical protein